MASPDAYARFYSRLGLALAWTTSNVGPDAKVCRESGSGSWKQARPLSPEPGAAAGEFTKRLTTRNPVGPVVANRFVLFDCDGAPVEELAARYEIVFPAGAWRVPTARGTHIWTSAPDGCPGLKVELTPDRVTVITDGYGLLPLSVHPSGLTYDFENVDVTTERERPPAIDAALLERIKQLAGGGREHVARLVDGADPIPVGDRHVALRHLAGRLRGEGLGRKAIGAALEELAERFVEPLENQRELRKVVDWVMSKPAPPPLDPVDLELLALLDELPQAAPRSEQRRASRAGQSMSWEQPVPFGARLPVPSFPLETLPGWQREWAHAIAQEKAASVDLAATLTLGVVAGGIARHVQVQPRLGWTEPLNVYQVTALDPGQRKTPMFKAAFRPIRALERRRVLEWENQNALVRMSAAIVEKRRREVVAEAADDEELTPELLAERAAAITEGLGETKETPRPRLLTEDITPEGLTMLLAEHGRIIAASDEGAILFENFSGRYTQGSANWDLLNKAHSAGDLVVDRKTTGTVFVWDPALTLVLATQPRVLRDLWGKPGAEARGVLARPLYALPNPVYGTGRTPAADVAVLTEYERRVRALYEDVPLLMLDEEERPLPLTLHLDPAAETIFERYELELATERAQLGMSADAEGEGAYLGWLGKFAGQTARLAACLHAAAHWTTGSTANTTIDAATISAAVELACYFHAHALVVFGLMGELPEQRRASVILGWLRARTADELETLTVRDVHRTRGKGTTAAQTRAALRLLEEHGYVRIEKQPRAGRGGRASEQIQVHPELKDLGVWPDKPDTGTQKASSVRFVGSDAKDSLAGDEVAHRLPDCLETRAWRARDDVWRCIVCQPPAFPTEVVEERP